jgi:hypothetical protein
MKLISFVARALLVISLRAINQASENTVLNTTSIFEEKTIFNGIKLGLGLGTEKELQFNSFSMNIGLQTSIIGNIDDAGWGIKCDKTVENSCEIPDPTKKTTIKYFNQTYQAQKAQLFFRIDLNNTLITTNPTVDKAEVDLVVNKEKWILENWGILGLSPNGSFAKYFNQAHGVNSTILLQYTILDDSAPNSNITFDSSAYLNPKYYPSALYLNIDQQPNAGYFSGKANAKFASPDLSINNTELCFSTVVDEVILLPEPQKRCEAVQKIICEGKIGKDCNKLTADLSSAPSLIITMNDVDFEFLPEEYIYMYTPANSLSDDPTPLVDCRFGDIQELKDNVFCGNAPILAVGKLFFQKYVPVLAYGKDGASSIRLLTSFVIPHPLLSHWMLMVVLSVIATILGIAMLIRVIFFRKFDQNGNYLEAPIVESD